uniref:Uncharacterized protein n=1 Tax=Tanacetum cinerariifolium TaxID=118510 RepID=A0A6L2KQB8_TANCI|nr:hypothetical protein [Tanacetum cinerariifolium]
MVLVDYFNYDLKYLQGGISTMTYTASLTKTKAAQYDLPGIKDMFPNIGVLLKLPMINMHFGEFLIGKINVSPSMGDDVIEISSDKVEGSGYWNSLEYQDTADSKGKKVTKALSFYKMETDEVKERYIASCFMNCLEAYDDYEVKKGNKVVKKELIVSLKGELYFVKFIINPEEDDVEPGVILGRSFMRLVKGIVDFDNGVITVYPEPDPFEEDSKKTKKNNGSDINTMPYQIYEQLGRKEMKKVDIGTHSGRSYRDTHMHMICGIVNTLEILFLTFDGFCHQTFHAARSDVMRNTESNSEDKEEYHIKRNKFGSPTMETHDDEARSSRSKCFRQHKTVEEVLLPQVLAMGRIMGCDGEIDDMLRITLHEAGSDEEIFTSVAGIRAFNINEPIYAVELEEEGFNVYFKGGLHSDEHFNAQEYSLSISREKNLGLSRSHTSTIKCPILRVVHKMITYGLYQRTTGYDKIQKNDLWLLSMFDTKHQNRYENVAWLIVRVLIVDVVRSLSALIYCRDLDTTTLRDLINSKGKLIPNDLQPGVPRVGIPRPPSASMQDLYDRMCSTAGSLQPNWLCSAAVCLVLSVVPTFTTTVLAVAAGWKHGYGYLKEIIVRRSDNDLYKFKEGDFLRLRINDIEDVLLLVVQKRLTNLSGDDKKINITKPETTKPNIKKRDPYTPYQDPHGFIYVDTLGRNRFMRSDELYKFSDGTFTRLRTSLEDITKNIHMEYLPKIRWSTLEKKRAHIMIKASDKRLKEKG